MDQDILFRVALADHPDNVAKLKALADSVRSTVQSIEQSVIQFGRTTENTARSIEGSRISMPIPITHAAASGGYSATTVHSDYQAQLDRLAATMPTSLAGPGPRFTAPPIVPAAPTVFAPVSPAAAPPPIVPPADEIPPASGSDSFQPAKQGRDDAKRYKTSFSETIGQLAGLEGNDLKLLVGGDKERYRLLGEENGKAYRDSLRGQLAADLGLSGDVAEELFSARGGPDLAKQQSEHAAAQKQKSDAYKAESESLMQSLTANIEAYGKLDSAGQQASQSLGKNFRELAEKSEGFASGLGQVASGLAFLGARNKNIETIVQSLLSVKGFADVGVGTVKTISNIAQVVSLWGERQKLASQQQEIATEKTRIARTAAADYVALLQREGIELQKATQGNREHAQILARVAAEARNAAAAERQHATAASTAAAASGGSMRARGGRGFVAGLGGLLGAEAITSFGGGGLMSTIGGYGVDAVVGRLSAGGAVGTGTALTGLATTAAAAAAALGSLAMVGREVYESANGTATKFGSLTDTIASWEVRILDLLGDKIGYGFIGGLFIDDLVGGSKQGAKADAAMKKRREREALDAIANSNSSDQLAMASAGRASVRDFAMSNAAVTQQVMNEAGRGTLSGISLQRDNLRRELMMEQQFAGMFSGPQTIAGQRRADESQRKVEQLRRDIANLNTLAVGTAAAGGTDPEFALMEKRNKLTSDLQQTKKTIAKLEKDGLQYESFYQKETQRSIYLQNELKTVEREHLELIKAQKQERVEANAQALAGVNARIDAYRSERKAAEDTINAGVRSFARMSMADQAAAIRAQELVDAGGAESLTDKQRSLLEAVGTQRARAGVEAADLAEAKKRGFFAAFPQEEMQRVEAATKAEQQIKVELVNRPELNVQLEVDYRKLAADVGRIFADLNAKGLAEFKKYSQAEVQRQQRDRQLKANQDIIKMRNELKK